MEGSEKLTGQDKAVLGFIWISSFIYALLNDQVGGLQHHHRHHHHHQGDEQGGEPAVQRARGTQFQPCTCWGSLGPGKNPPVIWGLVNPLGIHWGLITPFLGI